MRRVLVRRAGMDTFSCPISVGFAVCLSHFRLSSSRAAAYLSSRAITLLCESIGAEDMLLGKKSRTLDSFQSTYESLQQCALHDTDDVVKFHASRGLFELQDMYAKLFAAHEDSSTEAQVLEKFRIVK